MRNCLSKCSRSAFAVRSLFCNCSNSLRKFSSFALDCFAFASNAATFDCALWIVASFSFIINTCCCWLSLLLLLLAFWTSDDFKSSSNFLTTCSFCVNETRMRSSSPSRFFFSECILCNNSSFAFNRSSFSCISAVIFATFSFKIFNASSAFVSSELTRLAVAAYFSSSAFNIFSFSCNFLFSSCNCLSKYLFAFIASVTFCRSTANIFEWLLFDDAFEENNCSFRSISAALRCTSLLELLLSTWLYDSIAFKSRTSISSCNVE